VRAAAKAAAATRNGDTGWSKGMRVEVGGVGTVAHAGVVLPRQLADRLGLTDAFGRVVARAGFVPGRERGRLLTDAACALAAGATCLSDIEAMTAQVELFGPGGGASDSTVLRALEELADTLGGDGLPGRKTARAMAQVRDRAWQAIEDRPPQPTQAAGLPAVAVAGEDLRRHGEDVAGTYAQAGRPIIVVRLDATLVEAASGKSEAAGHYKGGFGFHPVGAWCSNTGESLAVMLRPGNAGSSTGSDHVKVLTAALAQLPARWRRDLLVTIDGAGASHEVVDHLTALNTAAEHGRRGRRVEYSIGWPVDERTMGALTRLSKTAWTDALTAEGKVDPDAQVAELTGILRPAGALPDELEGWPADLRVIARRTKRPEGKPAKLGQDVDFEYGAFVTNTATGQLQRLDARHRTQAHVEDGVKQTKACGARMLPSIILSLWMDHGCDLREWVVDMSATWLLPTSVQQGPLSSTGCPPGVSGSPRPLPRMVAIRCSPRALASASRRCALSSSRRRVRSVAACSRRSREVSEARCRVGGTAAAGRGWWRARSRSISVRRSCWA
jgi:hypothetical protein